MIVVSTGYGVTLLFENQNQIQEHLNGIQTMLELGKETGGEYPYYLHVAREEVPDKLLNKFLKDLQVRLRVDE